MIIDSPNLVNDVSLSGSFAVTGSITPGSSGAFDLGSVTKPWRMVYSSQLTGSLTRLADGTPFLLSSGAIQLVTGSNGSITISTTDAATVSGQNKWVQFNDAGSFGSNANFQFDKATSSLSIGKSTFNGTSTLQVQGQSDFTGSLFPGSTLTYDLGSTSKSWRDLYARTGSFSGDLTIMGDLTVMGTSSVINSEIVNIKDNAVLLNAGPAPLNFGGVYVADTTANTTGSMIWDSLTDRWRAGFIGNEINIVTTGSTDNLYNKTITITGTPSNNISGGTQGGVGYFDASGYLKSTSAGNSGQLLQSAGSGTPTWTNFGTLMSGSNVVTGSGTTNYVSKFSSGNGLTNSILYDDGTNVGIGTSTSLSYKLQVQGSGYFDSDLSVNGSVSVYNIGTLSSYNFDTRIGTYSGKSIVFGQGTAGTEFGRFLSTGLLAVTGTVEPGVNLSYDLGSSSKSWRSLYVNSLSGSLTKLLDDTSYLIAGGNMSVITGSNGAITLATINSGTIHNVTAGNGLLGGGTSGTVTLAINDSVVATVSGTTFSGTIKPNQNNFYDLGSTGARWYRGYIDQISGSLTKLVDGTSYLIAGSNIQIATGSNGSVTVTNAATGAAYVAGSNTQVQFNDGGTFGASSNLTFNKNTGALTGTYVLAGTGFSGSLTRLIDGTSYIVAGGNMTVTTGSNGSVSLATINSGTIHSVVAGNGLLGGGTSGAVTLTINDSVVATVSGTTFQGTIKPSQNNFYDLGSTGARWYRGYIDQISGSHTKLVDGTSFLIAGNNVQITTGSSGAVTISATASGATFVAGSDTQVQFNDGGTFGADADFTFDKTRNLLKVTNISGSLTGSNVLAGQVVLAAVGGVLSGSNNFFWNNANGYVGIGTSTVNSRLTIGNDFASINGIAIDTGGSDDSAIVGRRAVNKTAFGLLPWDTSVFHSAGTYYDGSNWVHHNATGDSQIFELMPASGVRWWSSSNSTVTFNVANAVTIWDDGGRWKSSVQSTRAENSYFTGGNVGIGTTNTNGNKLAITGGNLSVTGSVLPGVTATYDLGSTVYRWRDLYARSGSFTGDLTVSGDLIVAGTQFIVNTQVVEIEDNAILVNAGPAPAATGGIYVADTTTGVTGSLLWDCTTDLWKAGRLGSEVTLVSGSGTNNYLTKWVGSNAVTTSVIYDDGTNVVVGTSTPHAKLGVIGDVGAWSSNGTSAGSPIGASLYLGDINYYNSSFYNTAPGLSSIYDAGQGVAASLGLYTYNGSRVERMRIDSSGNVGIGTIATTDRLAVNGTMSVTGSLLPGVNSTYNLGSDSKLWLTLHATNLSGSLTRLSDGTSYMIAGSNVTITTGSSGAVTVSAPNLAPSTSAFVTIGNDSTLTNERALTAGTGILLVDGGSNSTVTLSINDNVVATVSGTTFTGVTKHNAGLSGSLTKLTDGTSYLIAGANVQVTTGSNGAVTVANTATGATYVAGSDTQVQFNDGGTFGADGDFTFSKSLNLLKVTNISGSLTGSNVTTGQVVLTATGGVLSGSNDFFWSNSNGRVGIGTSSPAYKLDVPSGDANFYGIRVGRGNASTGGNVVVGSGVALASVTSGIDLTAVGDSALAYNSAGSDNTSVGFGALFINSTGNNNTAVGSLALFSNDTSSNSTAVGYAALGSATGARNTAFGAEAGYAITTGTDNVFLGRQAGYSVTTGGSNTIIGSIAGTTSLSNTIILAAGTAERIRVDSNGNVGIATTSYSARLYVTGSSSPTTPTTVVREGAATPTGGTKTFEVQNYLGTSLMYVSGSGEIGIGSDAAVITSNTTTTSTSTVTLLAVSSTVFRSAEFVLQAVDTTGGKYHTAKILAIHNGSTTSHTEYGAVTVGGIAGTFDVTNPSGGFFNLQVTPASTNSTVWKVTAILTKA